MAVGVLGPLQIVGARGLASLGRRQERLLVAALAVRAGDVVPVDRLLDDLWADQTPAAGAGAVHPLVSRVRKAFATVGASEQIERRGAGYSLIAEDDAIDARRFQQLAASGRAAMAQGDADAALKDLDQALELWRGSVLADLDDPPFAAVERARLDELRVAAQEDRIDALLALGRAVEAAADTDALVAVHPFRERLWAQLMLAHYRAGRQADALATYRRARSVLVDELGIEPGPPLQRLEQQVLQQDPALDLTSSAGISANRERPRIPPIAYVRSGSYAIAWQEFGDGPGELVLVPSFVSNLELQWDVPTFTAFLEALAERHRVVLFDQRGAGLSDRVPPDQLPDVHERAADLRAVMDAAGLTRPNLVAFAEGAAASVVLGATNPERVDRLVVYAGYARGLAGDDGEERALNAALRTVVRGLWGSGGFLAFTAPSCANDAAMLEFFARFERQSASPTAATTLVEIGLNFDVESYLPAVRAPTLVLHRAKDPVVPLRYGAAIAEGIPGARLEVVDGVDHPPYFGDTRPLLDAIRSFLH